MNRFFGIFFFLPIVAFSQSFQNSTNSFKGVWDSRSVFADLDNDGDLDILISGAENSVAEIYTRIYSNDGEGVFTEVSQVLPGVDNGYIEVGDFDNDGRVDILIIGGVSGSAHSTLLYRNKGSFVFEDVASGLPELTGGKARFADYDRDGDLDLLLVGSDLSDYYNDIYQNNSGYFSPLKLNLPADFLAAAAWQDYDNDGDLDFIVSGNEYSSVTIYRNEGADAFSLIEVSQPGLTRSTIEWGDYNSDGFADFFVMGRESITGKDIFNVFMNKGNDTFEKTADELDAMSIGNAVWGDMDNDGDKDIVCTGFALSDSENKVTCIYINDNGSFVKQTAGLPQLMYSNVVVGDADNDLDLDILLTGASINASNQIVPEAFLYLNKATKINTKPNVPNGLQSTVDGQMVMLSWNQSDDLESTSNGISYNIYIGLNAQADNLKTSLSAIPSGYRKIVNDGNAGRGLSISVDNFDAGTYYWAVQTIDAGFIGSAFSEESSFEILNSPPSIDSFQPVSAIAGSSITIKGKNFIGTNSVEINGAFATFKIINSTTINAIVPDGDISGTIEITTSNGSIISLGTFCLIPTISSITGPTSVCPEEQTYEVAAPKAGVTYDWTVSEGGYISENNNSQIKVTWKEGGNYSLRVIPVGCIAGTEELLNIQVKGPLPAGIDGNLVPETETEEHYLVPFVYQESYLWELSGGGTLIGTTGNGTRVQWTEAGIHQLKVIRSNPECPSLPVETIQNINVSLNDFSFTNSVAAGSTAIQSDLTVADFDDDKDLDMIAVDGVLYENKGNSIFEEHVLTLPSFSQIKVIDVDLDNNPDVLMMTVSGEMEIYLNMGDFDFIPWWKSSEVFNTTEINSIDYDNDGDLDVFTIGNSSLTLYENKGSGVFEKSFDLSDFYKYIFAGKSRIMDINQDGLKDIITTKGGVFINTGAKSFIAVDIEFLNSYYEAYRLQYRNEIPPKNLVWEDVTNDGVPDLVEFEGGQIIIHEKSGNQFIPLETITLAGSISSLSFIDFNDDGFKDLIIGGEDTQVRLYNSSTKNYRDIAQNFPNFGGTSGVFDINQDLSVDLIFPATGTGNYAFHFYKNNLTNVSLPSIPTSLSGVVHREDVTLQWEGALGQTFNIVVGTGPGKSDIVSPLSDIGMPFKKTLTNGNAHNALFYQLSLEPGAYYWSVQAEDIKGSVSDFSEFHEFTIQGSSLQAPSNLTLSMKADRLSLKWEDNSTNEMGFIIERSQDDFNNFTEISEVEANVTTYDDLTYQSNSIYVYRVKATSPSGDSGYSNKESSDKAIISNLPYYESFENA